MVGRRCSKLSFCFEHRSVIRSDATLISPSIDINLAMVFASIANIQLGSSDEFATGGYSSQVTTGDNLQYAFLAMNVFNNILLTGLIGTVFFRFDGPAPVLISFSSGKALVLEPCVDQIIRHQSYSRQAV